MVVENGNWIMQGVEPNDPKCIHTVEEAITYIEKVGFLPLFKNEITGFSLEEFTVPSSMQSESFPVSYHPSHASFQVLLLPALS